MHHSQNDEFMGYEAKVDRVRKPRHQRTARFAVDALVSERVVCDAGKSPLDSGCEDSPKTGSLLFIPTLGVE